MALITPERLATVFDIIWQGRSKVFSQDPDKESKTHGDDQGDIKAFAPMG